MKETFDIFWGRPAAKDAKWVESVEGLNGAEQRMRELAAQHPGHYFIFNTWNESIVAEFSTQPQRAQLNKVKVAGAA